MPNYLNRRKKNLNGEEGQQLNKEQLGDESIQPGTSKLTTRFKIKLGELMIKANLHQENVRTVLLGGLLEMRDKLDSKHAEEYRRQWWLRGDKLLSDLSAEKMKESDE